MPKLGFYEKIINADKSSYKNALYSVKLNNFNTVYTGMKQGCLLSPLLFNFYINDLVLKLKLSCIGVDIDGENVPILLYADDIVLKTKSETE